MSEKAIKYEPRGDRVVVRKLEPPAAKAGELIIPGSQQKPLNEGIILAVGPGMRNRVTGMVEPIGLDVGDHICYVDFSGFEIDVDGELLLSLREEEVHGRRVSTAHQS